MSYLMVLLLLLSAQVPEKSGVTVTLPPIGRTFELGEVVPGTRGTLMVVYDQNVCRIKLELVGKGGKTTMTSELDPARNLISLKRPRQEELRLEYRTDYSHGPLGWWIAGSTPQKPDQSLQRFIDRAVHAHYLVRQFIQDPQNDRERELPNRVRLGIANVAEALVAYGRTMGWEGGELGQRTSKAQGG